MRGYRETSSRSKHKTPLFLPLPRSQFLPLLEHLSYRFMGQIREHVYKMLIMGPGLPRKPFVSHSWWTRWNTSLQYSVVKNSLLWGFSAVPGPRSGVWWGAGLQSSHTHTSLNSTILNRGRDLGWHWEHESPPHAAGTT